VSPSLGFRDVTTSQRLRLPADLVAELEAAAAAEGISVEELAARLLVDVLPGMVAEETERWLRTTLSLAYPVEAGAVIDVPGISEGHPENRSVNTSQDMKRPRLVGRGQLPNIKATSNGTPQGSTT